MCWTTWRGRNGGIPGWPTPSAAGTISSDFPDILLRFCRSGAPLWGRACTRCSSISVTRATARWCSWAATFPVSSAASVRSGLRLLCGTGPERPVVLGPADDGGYYLIGLGRPRRTAVQRHRLEHGVGAGTDPGQSAGAGAAGRDGSRHLRRRRGGGLGEASSRLRTFAYAVRPPAWNPRVDASRVAFSERPVGKATGSGSGFGPPSRLPRMRRPV